MLPPKPPIFKTKFVNLSKSHIFFQEVVSVALPLLALLEDGEVQLLEPPGGARLGEGRRVGGVGGVGGAGGGEAGGGGGGGGRGRGEAAQQLK